MKILMFVGSLRAESFTARVAQHVAGGLPHGTDTEVYAGLADLPHYSEDLDTDTPPESVAALRRAIEDADGLVVATPEYNGAMPGVLKNAIDWASRPRGASALDAKPTAVFSVSPSPRGAQWAREEAVKVLGIAGAATLERNVGVPAVHTALIEDRIADADVRRDLADLTHELVTAVDARAEAALDDDGTAA